MRMKLIVGVIVSQLVVAFAASAQETAEGDAEILTSGLVSVQKTGGGSTAGFLFGLFQYGRFLSDRGQVLGGVNFSKSFGAGGGASVGVNGGYRRYFGEQGEKVQPYFGGVFNIINVNPGQGQSLADFTTVGGVVGFKYFLSRTVSFDVNGQVGFPFKSPSDINVQVLFGFAFLIPTDS